MNPIHEHDCDRCRYLGSDTEYNFDYYYCPSEPTLVARYGVDGQYMSGIAFYQSNPHINKAGNLAIESGLLSIDVINEHLNRPINKPVII